MAGLEDTVNGVLEEEKEIIAGEIPPIEATQEDQKKFLGKIKKRNKNLLINNLTKEEKQRIADYVIEQYQKGLGPHMELCDKINTWDDVARLVRAEVLGTDGNMPNYRSPLSFVAHEVIHANIMNVFFTPKEPMRVIPTAQDDVPKVNNIATFGNWSMKNEMDLFNSCDRLFHASTKCGESVAMIYWKKEYGVEIKREPLVDDNGQTVYDEYTQEPLYQEIEKPKLVYDAPYMEILNRKDYMQPPDAKMGQRPEWEIRILSMSYDKYLRGQLEGKYYDGTIDDIKNWPASSAPLVEKTNYDGDTLPVGEWKKEFIEFYGRMRISIIEEGKTEQEAVKAHELEDEFICLVNKESRVLSSIRKNRFPMKERPFVVDYFVPDDTGQRAAMGVYELMDSVQKCYDALFNNFIYATQLANNPIVFFSPTGNMRDEKIKLQMGYMYPTSDPNSVKLFSFPGPDQAIKYAMELAQQWAQFMFGISDYAAGMESTIDSSAPAKKVEIIVNQGNVRLNMIIKRKNDTLKEIFKRWFLLYRDNMPPNKFMRIAGETGGDPFKFEAITYEDFSLKSIPDFELVGNVLNANKQLELQKAIAVYQMLVVSPLFAPNTREGLQGLMSLTKWLVSKIDDTGLTAFLPQFKEGNLVHTPEEENALMMQGQTIEPLPDEDHMYHLKIHTEMLNSRNTPEEVLKLLAAHIDETVKMLQQQAAKVMAIQHQAQNITPMQGGIPTGGMNGARFPEAGAAPETGGVFPAEQSAMV